MNDTTRRQVPTLEDFPLHSTDKLRYGDTDRQGHVNNVMFSRFLETGRVEFIYDPDHDMPPAGTEFMLVSQTMQLLAEINWPGEVVTGTRIERIGTSSMTFAQATFQDGRCAMTAETVVVLIDSQTRRPTPYPEATRAYLSGIGG